MTLPYLVINLDRSPERWQSIQERGRQLGMRLVRVPAVDGARVAPADRVDVDAKLFTRQWGRTLLQGEYGCYRSHLRALEMVCEMDVAHAVILEDDIEPDAEALHRVEAIIETVPRFDVVKLVNHRTRFFLPRTRTALGDEIGRCLHGPLGSAAAYLVSGTGARRLRHALACMWLPWDVALERYWESGIIFYTVRKNVFSFSPHRATSMIAPQSYKRSKPPLWRRGQKYAFEIKEISKRVFHAVKEGVSQ